MAKIPKKSKILLNHLESSSLNLALESRTDNINDNIIKEIKSPINSLNANESNGQIEEINTVFIDDIKNLYKKGNFSFK